MRYLYTCVWLLAIVVSLTTAEDTHGEGGIISETETIVKCKNNRHRRPDGQCNNLHNPRWGSANTYLARWVASAYGDGQNSPRTKAFDGSRLPSARTVSRNCHAPSDDRSDLTLMVMQWGQFLDHDITKTAGSAESSDHVKCTCDSKEEVCFNIPVGENDHFSPRPCLEFTRSAGTIAKDGFSAARQQTNTITAYVDASNVYGSSINQLKNLLNPDDPVELRELRVRGQGPLLPKGDDPDCKPKDKEHCFLAGDARVNEQPGLSAMHTIFMLQHNKIARFFKRQTDWKPRTIFLETRKIIEAMMQKITYSDFLPLLLSKENYRKYGLGPWTYTYNPKTRPDILNSFATAAFRFGHTLIPDGVEINGNTMQFKNMFFTPTQMLTAFHPLVFSLTEQKSMGIDAHFSEALTNHLFQVNSDKDGSDLAALNIQRGRDHGLPPYNTFRALCNLPKYTSLTDLFGDDEVAIGTYRSIDDVDLFTGGMREKPDEEGGLLGPTFQCVIGEQFKRLKEGDRYFYLSQERSVGFNKEQLAAINTVTLSKIICHNTKQEKLQENIFLPVDPESNPAKPCDGLPSLDLNKWLTTRKSIPKE